MVALNDVGYQSLVVSDSAVSLTKPTGLRPTHVLIGVSGGAIRWRSQPNDPPTPTYGSYVGAGGTIDWTRTDTNYAGLIDNVKFIKAGVADATLEITYFG